MQVTGKNRILRFALLGLALPFFLAGCALDRPTFFAPNIEVAEEYYKNSGPTAEIGDAIIDEVARHHTRYGDGSMEITVTYNPQDTHNTARQASENAAMLASAFRKRGIEDLKTNILPINKSSVSMTYIEYPSVRARMAEGCQNVRDIEDDGQDNYYDYMIGCTTQDIIAQQISRPKDLLGRTGDVETDGRKIPNIIEAFRWGADLSSDVGSENTQ